MFDMYRRFGAINCNLKGQNFHFSDGCNKFFWNTVTCLPKRKAWPPTRY